MRITLILIALLALAGCGMKPNFPKAPPGSPPGRTYPDPATDPKPAKSPTNPSQAD
jgi:predicted small lipoprotein YifL